MLQGDQNLASLLTGVVLRRTCCRERGRAPCSLQSRRLACDDDELVDRRRRGDDARLGALVALGEEAEGVDLADEVDHAGPATEPEADHQHPHHDEGVEHEHPGPARQAKRRLLRRVLLHRSQEGNSSEKMHNKMIVGSMCICRTK